ncbi:MAG: glycerophosphodiester phosphodiesterase family protein [Vitreimonas sp.]
MRRALIALALALTACGQQQSASAPPSATPAQAASASAGGTLAPANLPAFFDCLRESHFTAISAHRGGPAPGFAENAIPTFEHTLARAPAIMEVDIARTRDNVLVLMHDDSVDRTTNGRGQVDHLTAAQVSALRLRDEDGAVLNAHPPTLREALDWAEGKTILALDVKRGVSYEDVAHAVAQAHAMNRVAFIAYGVAGAARLHQVAPNAMLFVSIRFPADLDDLVRRDVDLNRVVAWTGTDQPNSGLNIELAQRGVEVEFGTLGGRRSWDSRFAEQQREQYAAFADTGLQLISTGRPAEALADLDAHDNARGYGAPQCVGAH